MVDWFGLGKRRTKLGQWLDQRGVPQQELVKRCRVSKTTVGRLCSDEDYSPTLKTAKKIIHALRQFDKNVNYDDFWTM